MITNRSRLMGSMIHYFTLIAPKSQVYKIVTTSPVTIGTELRSYFVATS